jgi:hypothetical protein
MAEPEPVDRQVLLTTLTTEHFTLQGARASTISESSARSSVYFGALSAALVSLGFVAQASAAATTFHVFALVVLPTVFVLGVFTFVRLVETSIEDFLYGRAINRIRSYYLQLAGPEARLFLLGGHDDAPGVLRNMGLTTGGFQLYLTISVAIAFVNSIVGGSALALACAWTFDTGTGAAAAIGGAFALVAIPLHVRWTRGRHERGGPGDVLFPSPEGEG